MPNNHFFFKKVQARASLDELKERALLQLQRNDAEITKLKNELSTISNATNEKIQITMDEYINKTNSHLEDAFKHVSFKKYKLS